MKKLLLFLSVTFCILHFHLAQAQIPSYVPTNGLVGYWPFNGNANDESGNGNNGTVNGATLTTDRFGNANGAYHFTLASSNYISTPGNNLPIGSSSSTMSIWFNATGYSNSGMSRAMLSYGIWNSNKARYIGQRGGSSNVLTYAQLFNDKNCTFNYSLNTWYNFVVTYDTGVVKMYINSNLIGTYTITGTATSQGNVYFGCHPSLGDFFDGNLDDAAIYNRALSQSEITQLYTGQVNCFANIINNDTTICTGTSIVLNATTATIPFQLGMNAGGGKIFFINPDGVSGLVAAPFDQGSSSWQCIPGVSGLTSNDGLYNTNQIVAGCSENGAARICYNLVLNGYDDWYLPAIDQVNLMYQRQSYIGGFNGNYYWSSTDFTGNYAYAQTLPSGNQNYFSKSNVYGIRAIRNFSQPLTSAYTYLWSNGSTTPSITVSPTATTTYYLTVTDANGNTCRDSVKVTVNTAIPATPGTITGATDVCSSFSSITAASSNAVTYSIAAMSTATSYTWAVPAGVTIVSGQGTSSISVSFANTFVSGAITVKANNACGSSTAARSLSVYRRVAATPGTVQKSFVPSVVAVTSVCGLASEVYMIRKVTYATSYNWSLALGTNATITHLNALGANDTAIRVTFASGFVRDTIRVTAQTACSVSALRTVVLNATVAPPAVTALSTPGGNFSVCIGSSINITALSTVPTATQSAIQYFRWTKPANTTITAATADSSRITLRIDAGFTGGSVSVKTASACGFYGAAKTATLQYLPPTPVAISSATGSYNACIGNTVSYTVLVGQALSSQSVATVFRWTKPANTTIVSATADSITINLRIDAGFTGGSLTVKGQSSCGAQGAAYSQVLTHGGCPAGTRTTPYATNDGANTKLTAQLFPNPTTNAFNLKVSSTNTLPVVAIIRDAEGRLIKSFTIKAGELSNFGNELTSGVYMIEVMQGEERKVMRGVKM